MFSGFSGDNQLEAARGGSLNISDSHNVAFRVFPSLKYVTASISGERK
jgi:hypothetical protein